MISLKSAREIEIMRRANIIVAEVLQALKGLHRGERRRGDGAERARRSRRDHLGFGRRCRGVDLKKKSDSGVQGL